MAAPIESYFTASANLGESSETIELVLAKPISAYMSGFPATTSKDQMLENFKALFHLDEVRFLTIKLNDGSLEPGIVAFVRTNLIHANNSDDGESNNAKYHNIDPVHTSRKHPSEMRFKNAAGDLYVYTVMNDAGLNCRPEISVNILAAYANFIAAKATIKSAYYSPTIDFDANVVEVKTSGDGNSDNVKNDFAFSKIGSNQNGSVYGECYFVIGNMAAGKRISLRAQAINEEGGMMASQEIVVGKPIQVNLPVMSKFDQLPLNWTQFQNNQEVIMKYWIYEEDFNRLGQVPQQYHGSMANPPKFYVNYYLDSGTNNKFPSCWITFLEQSGSSYKFYHINNNGQAEYYKMQPLVFQKKQVVVTVGVRRMEPSEIGYDQFYPYSILVSAYYMNVEASDRKTVTINGALSGKSSDGLAASGVRWKGVLTPNCPFTLQLNPSGQNEGLSFKADIPSTIAQIGFVNTTMTTDGNYELELKDAVVSGNSGGGEIIL